MNLEEILDFFDFENCDYYYHITGKGVSDMILEEGLLVDGTNILGTNNLKDTTTIEITPDMVATFDDLKKLVDDEINHILMRDASEMVIIGSLKEDNKRIVNNYNQNKDEHFYRGIIPSNHIMGYIDENHTFIANENYSFGNEAFEESFYDPFRKPY